MREEFVSELIVPVEGAFDFLGAVVGEPGLPGRFFWRKKEYEVAEVLEKWKENGPCRNGSGEMYLRKHWFQIMCKDGTEMIVYFERQAKSKREIKKRWWLYTVKRADDV